MYQYMYYTLNKYKRFKKNVPKIRRIKKNLHQKENKQKQAKRK